jgi:hypothetical protein
VLLPSVGHMYKPKAPDPAYSSGRNDKVDEAIARSITIDHDVNIIIDLSDYSSWVNEFTYPVSSTPLATVSSGLYSMIVGWMNQRCRLGAYGSLTSEVIITPPGFKSRHPRPISP